MSIIFQRVSSVAIFLVALISGCQRDKPETVSHPPENAGEVICYDFRATTVGQDGAVQSVIRKGEAFQVTGKIISPVPVPKLVHIKVLQLRGQERPGLMSSKRAKIVREADNRYRYEAELNGVKSAGVFVAQVCFEREVVDEATVTIVEE